MLHVAFIVAGELETQALVLEENDCKNSCRDFEKGSSDIIALVILIYSCFINCHDADKYNTIAIQYNTIANISNF